MGKRVSTFLSRKMTRSNHIIVWPALWVGVRVSRTSPISGTNTAEDTNDSPVPRALTSVNL